MLTYVACEPRNDPSGWLMALVSWSRYRSRMSLNILGVGARGLISGYNR